MVETKGSHDERDAPLESIVDSAIDSSDDGCVTFRDVFTAWDDRSYGPLFIILGIIGGTPLAAVPGAAAIVGVMIVILSVQMVAGKAHPWLPGLLLDRSVKEDQLRDLRGRLSPMLRFIDHLITERLNWATGDIMRRVAAGIVTLLGVAMIPFDAIPFAVAAPSWAVVLFGVAITARDGLVMLIAVIAFVAILQLGFQLL
ncbi:exopolysaccharide biosynthesis protein [Hyphococcus sp. DH-69]|uniref:exopolysaccharide biosynthesis protein n=1 Tax=Hyphococcus formosus TaxID=3143534 RepID=UPI00398BA5BC